MGKPATIFVCQSCGSVHGKWAGRCDACGQWNTLVEEVSAQGRKGKRGPKHGRGLEFVDLSSDTADVDRLPTGSAELDRVTGGGLVEGSALLIGGDPGIGKSTLLLQLAGNMAGNISGREGLGGLNVAYISGEESTAQVSRRAERLGMREAKVNLAAETSLSVILDGLSAQNPDIIIIDSIQTMWTDQLGAAPGTVAQVRACAQELTRFAKKRGAVMFLVGHVTKDGQIAGPRVVEHMVDAVLYFEGERSGQFRILRAHKNRFGPTDEIGVFEMCSTGLREVENPSALFLDERGATSPGAVVFAGLEGTRPVLTEIQALVAPSAFGTPRRAVVGWDSGRLAMVLAVLEARCGLSFAGKDVYLNVAGGFRITEPAADLAVAAALVSSIFETALPVQSVVFGEISLSGEVRSATRAEARLKEAAKLGFSRAFTPMGKTDEQGSKKPDVLPIHEINTLPELISCVKALIDECGE